jgi:hypothetical protein
MATKDGPADGRRDVLTALPHTRPTRRSAKRAAARGPAGRGEGGGGAAKPAAPKRATRKPAAAKPAAARNPRTRKAAASPKAADARRDKVPPAGYATPGSSGETHEPLRRGELVTTAVEAVGELAQLGVTAGVQGLRSALRRLPRP